MTAAIPHPYPEGGAGSFIYQSRVGNAQGSQLTFAISPLARPHEAIGIVSLRSEDGMPTLGYWLAPPCCGRGVMSEAVEALIDTTFQLTSIETIYASARSDNPASRRVLEKCGFQWTGVGLCRIRAIGSSVPVDRFRLERGIWTALKSWGPFRRVA